MHKGTENQLVWKKPMEDAPFKNTWSSTGSLNKSNDKISHVSDTPLAKQNTTEVFEPQPEVGGDKTEINDKPKERVRTPSGHLTTASVGDIRNFFSQQNSATAPYLKGKSSEENSINRNKKQVTACKPCNKIGTGSQKTHSQQTIEVLRTPCSGEQSATNSVTNNDPIASLNFESIELEDNTDKEAVKQTRIKVSKDLKVSQKQHLANAKGDEGDESDLNQQLSKGAMSSSIDTHLERLLSINKEMELQKEQSIPVLSEPKVMDLQIVIQMFKEIKNDLTNYKKEVNATAFNNLKSVQEEDSEMIKTLQKELEKQKEKTRIMSGTMQRMSKSLCDLEGRVLQLEKHNCHRLLVLSGLEVAERKVQHE